MNEPTVCSLFFSLSVYKYDQQLCDDFSAQKEQKKDYYFFVSASEPELFVLAQMD